MKLRNRLDDLGKMEGVNTAEKGQLSSECVAIVHHSLFLHRSRGVSEHVVQTHTVCGAFHYHQVCLTL